MIHNENLRILIIDDNQTIHQDFRKILLPQETTYQALDDMYQLLNKKTAEKSQKLPKYEIDSAFQGEEGAALVKKALDENKPYAMAFVDVQMPPGIDGIETIEKIWTIDEKIQIVICTAYAKYSWEDILARFGVNERLFILKKPFDTIEIIQLATSLTKRWNVIHAIEKASQTNNILDHTNKELDDPLSHLHNTLDMLNKTLKKF